MTNRHKLEQALAGAPIQHPVYTVYDWFVQHRPQVDWPTLFDQGLGQIMHADVVVGERPNVAISESITHVDGKVRRDVTWVTDIGELHEWYLGEWRMEHLVKTDDDYRILQHAISGSRFTPTDAPFLTAEQVVGQNGITLGQLDRTPLQKVQIDYVGLERFSVDLAMETPQLLDLLAMMNELKMAELDAALQTTATHLKLWENLSIITMGPEVYRRHLVPLYRRMLERMQGSGKRLHVHYDGQLQAVANDIRDLALDGIDSFTQTPEGDMTVAEARAVWPEKFLWIHPNLGWFAQPEATLVRNIRQTVADAGASRYCLMISEEVPDAWATRVPVVLNTLKQLN